jgi:hypothetical protein
VNSLREAIAVKKIVVGGVFDVLSFLAVTLRNCNRLLCCRLVGERPFACEICKKAFNQKNALQTHLRKHRGERPHQCDYCSMAFTQKGNLKTHVKRAHRTEINAALTADGQGASTAADQSFLLIDKELKLTESATILKLSESSGLIKLSDSSSLLKFADGSVMHGGVSDDLDLTAESHLNFM